MQWPAIGSRRWPTERIITAHPLTTTQEVAEELSVDHSSVVWHLKQTGEVKKLNKWVPHELPPPKNHCFEALSSLILRNNKEPFLDWIVICKEEWILPRQPEMISSVAGSRRSSKAHPKAKVHQKKVVVTGGLLLAWSTIALWSQQNHYIWEVCSANRWDAPETATPVAGIGQQNGPNSLQQRLTIHPTTNASKVEWIGLRSFASSAIFTWSLANQPTLLQASQQLFAGKMPPQPAGGRKYFPRVLQILKHRFLRYKNKQTFLVGKNVLIVMVPILIIKDVLEPSYNNLKFTVWNHNYFCINLIFTQ